MFEGLLTRKNQNQPTNRSMTFPVGTGVSSAPLTNTEVLKLGQGPIRSDKLNPVAVRQQLAQQEVRSTKGTQIPTLEAKVPIFGDIFGKKIQFAGNDPLRQMAAGLIELPEKVVSQVFEPFDKGGKLIRGESLAPKNPKDEYLHVNTYGEEAWKNVQKGMNPLLAGALAGLEFAADASVVGDALFQAGKIPIKTEIARLTRQDLIDITAGRITSGAKYDAFKEAQGIGSQIMTQVKTGERAGIQIGDKQVTTLGDYVRALGQEGSFRIPDFGLNKLNPKVRELENSYNRLQQKKVKLPEGSQAYKQIVKAQQAITKEIRNVEQGGFARIPGGKPEIKPAEDTFYTGAKGKVDEVKLDLKNKKVATIQGDQKALTGSSSYVEADQKLFDKYSPNYDFVKIEHPEMPQKATEYYNLAERKWYSQDKSVAEAYAMQSREAKYNPNQTSQDINVSDVFDIKSKTPTARQQLIKREEIKQVRNSLIERKQALNFTNPELEDQYQQFKKLKVKDVADEGQLKAKNPSVNIDNILYSQDKTGDEVFNLFQDRYVKERQPLPVIPKETKAIVAERVRQTIPTIKQEIMDKAKAIYDKKVAGIKDAKEILSRRRQFVRAVQERFGLSDDDLKSITRRDIRLMSNQEFKTFLDNVRVKSEKLAEQRQAYNELQAQIKEKELNIEPLREAMKLPHVSNMTTAQLREMDNLLSSYQKGDVFLSKRKLETIDRTELQGIKTYREAREILAKKLGTTPEELNTINVRELDRLRGDASLAERNPFFRMMIEEKNKTLLIRNAEYLEIKEKVNSLAKKLKTNLIEKLIPQQKNIARWFDAEDKSTISLTKEEADIVSYMQEEWSKALQYLIDQNALKKGINSDNYFTHIRRGVLEAVKEDGLKQAFLELIAQNKLTEQTFNILEGNTGEIMALDKFFRFAMHRTGGLKYSDNVVGSFLNYMRTFKKKQALDEIVPLIDIYANSLTPKGTTKTGLLLHGDLVRFTKEWLNTQKGRRVTLIAKQGGKLDLLLKAGKSLTTMLDLGLNVSVNLLTQVGEQVVTYQLLGKKNYLLAKARALTPQGRKVIAKYRNFIGESPWKQLIEPARAINDRLAEGLFTLFQDANVRRAKNFLLGSMTKEEFASGVISPERLARLKVDMGRYGVVDGAKSIMGATPEVGQFTQYKSWALPILRTTLSNLRNLTRLLSSNKEPGIKAAKELYRMAELTGIVALFWVLFGYDEEDNSFVGQLKRKAYSESFSLLQALNPQTLFTEPRNFTFAKDLADNLTSLVMLEEYKETKFGDYEAGDLKGLNKLMKQLTPRAIKQFFPEKAKTLEDIKAEIKSQLENGSIDTATAKIKFLDEVKKLNDKVKKERFALPLKDYKKDLKERIKNGEITVSDAKDEFIEYSKENTDSFESTDDSSFIEKVSLYAKAIGTDPVTAFQRIFTGDYIRRIDNGAIIVYRLPLDKSQEIKKRLGATKDLILDHTMPLELGGSNSLSNLKLVTIEDWESYTPVENYLGDKLRAGLISKKEAQDLIKKFKNGEITAEEIMK